LDEFLTLDYGSGGKKTSSLISDLVLPAFDNPYLRELGDGAVLPGGGELVVSTDSFVISPRFFPGGDIGKLSVCGTVNDVSMAGGDAKYVSLAVILEEGFPKEELERIVSSIAKTAKEAGFKPGDVVFAVDDRQITSIDDLTSIISAHKVGDKLKYTVVRDGETMELTITLQEKTKEQSMQ